MSPIDIVLVAAVSIAGGLFGGLLGVGGGVLFVPALVIFLDQSQLEAEATSLFAIVFVAAAGAWRQRTYGNVRLDEGLLIGALSLLGVAAGVVVANAVSQRVLEISFAALLVLVAIQLLRHAARAGTDRPPTAETAADP
jgi:uncharacterized membrane protein YfcA